MSEEHETPPSENTNDEAAIERAFLVAAAKHNCHAPEDALKLADTKGLSVNESGAVDGIDALFADLRKARPYLFRATATPGLDQAAPTRPSPQEELKHNAQASGLTRDIHQWRQATRRKL